MKRICAPVAVFVYNRPEHTNKVLNALNASMMAPETDLYIFCDNFKNEESKDMVLKTRDVIDSFSLACNFHKVDIRKADYNKGLATSIIEGVNELMDQYGKAIVIEDDILASIHFLEYMNAALDYYQQEKTVWSISGYSFPMKSLNNYPHDVYMSGRGCCWGWASWRDRWNKVDWNVSNYDSFKHNWLQRHSFAKWGQDLPLMLDAQMNMNHNSWAIRWCFSEFQNRMMTVYPKTSYVKNIGNDGSGTHKSTLENRFDTSLEKEKDFHCTFEVLPYDESIRREFRKKYSPGGTFAIWKTNLKWFLVRFGLYKATH